MNKQEFSGSPDDQQGLEILGCSGSLGDPENGTSCFRLNSDTLIDAGSGLTSLTTAEMSQINHVFLTHPHLDHVLALPLLIESRQHAHSAPLKVYGLPSTIAALKAHLFNNLIWPDFSVIPSPERPALEFCPIQGPVEIQIGGLLVKPFEVNHSVPTVGYTVRSKTGVIAISSDTYLSDEMASMLADCYPLDHLIIESSFSNKDSALSELTKHLCPDLLAKQLRGMKTCQNVWVGYLKEWDREQTEKELSALRLEFNVDLLRRGQVLRF